MEWLAPVMAALGTAILIPLFQLILRHRTESRKQEQEGFRAEYIAIVAEQRSEITRLATDLKSMTSRVAHLEALCDNEAPYPAWSVGLAGEYRWVNRAFESQILDPVGMSVSQIIGKTACEVWSADVAAKLKLLGPQPGFTFDNRLLGTRFLFQHKLLQGSQPVGISGIAPPE